MNQELLECLGQLIVTRVRDAMISSMDEALAGKRKDIYSKQLFELYQPATPEELERVSMMIPHVVDSTIEVFLQAIDHYGDLQLSIKDDQGTFVDALDLTEALEGEYGWDEGWKYSLTRERPDVICQEAVRISDETFVEPDWDAEP